MHPQGPVLFSLKFCSLNVEETSGNLHKYKLGIPINRHR